MTLTKSWLQKQITDLEATRDEIPFGLDEDGNNTLDALKMALAGMKAQPVAMRPSMLFDQFVSSITKGQRGLPDALIKDGVVDYEKIGVLWEEYRSAPQPLTTSERAELENYRNAQQVVPEWTNQQCLEFLSIAFRHAEIKGDLEMDDIRLGVRMVNACRAAMLQGAEPVTTDKESDVGENCWSCGKYFTYEQHSECDGYCPHCDSPVDLDDEEDHSSEVVPMEPTEEMISNAWREATGKCNHETIRRIYATMLAAAPQQEVSK